MGRASLAHRLWAAVSFLFIYIFVVLFLDLPRILFSKKKKVAGQVIVITGGAQGIGKEVGKMLATKHGATVCLLDVNEKVGRGAVEEITNAGGQAFFYRGDISDADEMVSVAEEIRTRHGSVDIVVANAAILKMAEFLDLSFDDFRKNSDVNILGPIFTVKAFLPAMITSGRGGHVVSIGSICSHFGEYCGTAYCTAKFANRGFMEALQMELYEKGLSDQIKLTSIFPYFVRTPFIQDLDEPYSTFFDVVEVETCAKEIVESILYERMTHFIPAGVGVLCQYLKCFTTKGTLPRGRRVFNNRYVPQRLPEKIV